MDRAQKQAEIESLKEKFIGSQLALCADYRGLTVAQITTLRKNLRGAGAQARVVKNKLAKIAAKQRSEKTPEAELFVELFKGPSFVVFSKDDPVAPTKVLADFMKTNTKFQIKGAWVDGQFLDASAVDALAKMPGRKELIAQLLSLINAPATRLVGLLAAPASQLVRVVDGHRKNLEEKGGS